MAPDQETLRGIAIEMSKYRSLWEYVAKTNTFPLKMSFEEIFSVLGFSIDHSFLSYKKETEKYGYIVKKVSLKEKSVLFDKP